MLEHNFRNDGNERQLQYCNVPLQEDDLDTSAFPRNAKKLEYPMKIDKYLVR
jgi:hypothetical protein